MEVQAAGVVVYSFIINETLDTKITVGCMIKTYLHKYIGLWNYKKVRGWNKIWLNMEAAITWNLKKEANFLCLVHFMVGASSIQFEVQSVVLQHNLRDIATQIHCEVKDVSLF